jgi:large subunit ribosomal protein L1
VNRIIRAFEAGYPPTSPKYDLALKFRTPKDGLVLKSRLTLPNPVRTDLRVAVITPSDGPIAKIAREAGAALVGTTEIFEQIKAGTINFERCICHDASFAELQKAGVARILGPRRLMPSPKEKTVVADVGKAVRELTSSAEYREKMGVVRLPVGQLGFTPEQMSRNIGAVLGRVKKDISEISDKVGKDIHEIVLSSTHGPGLTLNGDFATKEGCRPEELAERA